MSLSLFWINQVCGRPVKLCCKTQQLSWWPATMSLSLFWINQFCVRPVKLCCKKMQLPSWLATSFLVGVMSQMLLCWCGGVRRFKCCGVRHVDWWCCLAWRMFICYGAKHWAYLFANPALNVQQQAQAKRLLLLNQGRQLSNNSDSTPVEAFRLCVDRQDARRTAKIIFCKAYAAVLIVMTNTRKWLLWENLTFCFQFHSENV